MTDHKLSSRYSPEARDLYFTVPNLISALRIISIPFISALISRHEMIAALALIAISSASDGLDGIIARRFNQVSKIGQIPDPVADRLLIFCSILALGVAGVIPWWMLISCGFARLVDGNSGAVACPIWIWSVAGAFRGQSGHRIIDDFPSSA